MKNMLITDLMGTLIPKYLVEALVTDEDEYAIRHYHSHIAYIARKINDFLSAGNQVAIITSTSSHGMRAYQAIPIFFSIDELIFDENKSKIHYYINDPDLGFSIGEKYEEYDENPQKALEADLDKVIDNQTKEKALALINFVGNNKSRTVVIDTIFDAFPNHHFIAFDDSIRPWNDYLFIKTILSGGECSYIYSGINSNTSKLGNYHIKPDEHNNPHDFMDTLTIDEIINSVYVDKLTDNKYKTVEEVYAAMYSGQLDFEDFRFPFAKRNLTNILEKKYATHSLQIPENQAEELFDRGIISIEPSFERAYQRRISPKIRQCSK